MTLIIYSVIAITISVIVYIVAMKLDEHDFTFNKSYDFLAAIAIIFFAASVITLVVSTIFYIPSKKDSERLYLQFVNRYEVINKMLDSDVDIDILTSQEMILDYNVAVIKVKFDSKRFILKDYYSKDVDWDSLKTIEWR